MPETLAAFEIDQIDRANASGRTPVVFVHGLWLLASSWQAWAERFERAGYIALTPGWPDDPQTVEAANEDPSVFARKTIGAIAGHYERVIRKLAKKPAVVGHSFGGLLTEILAGRGLNAVSVAISPAPYRGVLPLPISALISAWPVLKNPANRNRAIPLTAQQFRYAFGNAVTERESQQLFERYAVPGAGMPLFESAAANLNPWTEDAVERNPDRGPMLLIAGAEDHTVPPAVVKASYGLERRDDAVTEYLEIPGRGHSLTIDNGWEEVAEAALRFVERFSPVAAPS
jgi:non-heme chloroperoxidase